MERTWKPLTAGILTIIAGSSGIGGGVLIVIYGGLLGLGGALAEVFGESMGMVIALIAGIVGVYGFAIIIMGIIAIICGIFTLRRRHWGLALAGAILATICSTLLGLLSIIFVSIGKDEFS
jgi:hypothetical protein